MFTWHDLASVPGDFAETVVTIGKFDGVHLGHQALLRETVELSEEHGLAAAAVTFDRHPNTLLEPNSVKLPLIGPNQKLDQLKLAGIDATLVLQFDAYLASLSPIDFIDEVLIKALKAKALVVGEDFRFGAGGAGDIETLKRAGAERGFAVKIVPAVSVDGKKVSSTVIRDLLDEGNVKQAAKLLGRNHAGTGMVEHGLKIGRELGFPTANLSRASEGYLPRDAVYAGWMHVDGERYPTALSVGINETVQSVPRLVEAHVIDRKDLNFYDKVVTIEYIDFIRPAKKFSGLEALISAIAADLVEIKRILGVS